TPPSPMPIVPSSQWMRMSSQRFHRRVSTCSILVGFDMGRLRRVLVVPFEKSLLYLANLEGRGYTYYAWPRPRLLSSKWGGIANRDLWTDAQSGPNMTASAEEVVGYVRV